MCDSGATVHMVPSTDAVYGWKICVDRAIRLADKALLPFAGFSYWSVLFTFDANPFKLARSDVAVRRRLAYNPFSLNVVNNTGHGFTGRMSGEVALFSDCLKFACSYLATHP